MLALLLSTFSFASGLDELQQITDEAVTEAQRLTGLTFTTPPRVASALSTEITLQWIKQELPEADEADSERLRRGMARISQGALGLYLRHNHTIYYLRDNLEDLIEGAAIPEPFVRPMLTCIAVHEVAHALADEQLPPVAPTTPEQALASRAMAEGYAEFIQARACGDGSLLEPAQAWTRSLQGTDVLAGRDPRSPHVFFYGYGRRFIALLHERGGMDLVHAAMQAPPPDLAMMVDTVEQTLSDEWADFSPVTATLETLVRRDGWEGSAGAASPVEVLQQSFFGQGYDKTPAATGGMYANGRRRGHSRSVYLFRFADPEEAAWWVSYRAEDIALMEELNMVRTGPGTVLDGQEWTLRTKDGVLKEKGGQVSLHYRIDASRVITDGTGFSTPTYYKSTSLSMEELWMAEGNVLAVVHVYSGDPQKLKLKPVVADLIARAQDLPPVDVPLTETAALDAWLVGVSAP